MVEVRQYLTTEISVTVVLEREATLHHDVVKVPFETCCLIVYRHSHLFKVSELTQSSRVSSLRKSTRMGPVPKVVIFVIYRDWEPKERT
jgi:hypothetical protein